MSNKESDEKAGEEKNTKEKSSEPPEDFDDIINLLGLGRWTLLMVSAYACWGMILPYFSLGSVFLNPNLEYWCADAVHPVTGQPMGNSTILWTEVDGKQSRSRCREYNMTAVLSYLELKASNTTPLHDTNYQGLLTWNSTGAPTQQCTRWEYDTSIFTSTVTMEWDLVCEAVSLSPFFQSFYYFGTTFGEPLLGCLSDKFGRRWTLRRVWSLFMVAAVGSVLSTNYSLLLLMRFLLGICHSAGSVAYVMVMESCPSRFRSCIGLSVTNVFAVAGIVFGGLAYLIRDWRMLQAVCILPALLHLCYLPLMDESPRWLAQNGETAKAGRVLERAAAWHNKQLPQHLQQLLQQQHKSHAAESDSSSSEGSDCYGSVKESIKLWLKDLVSLVKTPVLRRISLSMFGCFALVGLSYWGLSLAGGSFSSDPFLYMVLSSIMEIIGYTWIIPVLAFVGRRVLLVANFAISAVALFLILVIPDGNQWTILILAMVGKLFITAAYNLLYLFAVELFPTCVRNRGLNVSSMMARLASIASPFVVTLLASNYKWAPSMVFGSAAAVGALLALLLPESRHRPMLDTVEQLEHVYGSQRSRHTDAQHDAA
uniref:Organic cation transporter protein-like n=1 Tax=Hirondellea gigas TaxID=1518452 RepID=A0A6A7G5P2_9CRUS